MASNTSKLIGRGAMHVPGLKRLPMLKLLALAEIALLVQQHYSLLTPAERRRMVALLRKGHLRTKILSEDERLELMRLVAKAEPRRFAGHSVDAISPVPLPKRLKNGPKAKRR